MLDEQSQLVDLGQIATKITDGTHHTPNYTNDGVIFLSAKNLREGGIDFSDHRWISLEEHSTLIRRCNPQPGDVMVSKSGSLGTACVVPEGAPTFSLFESVALIKLDRQVADADFVSQYLNSPHSRRHFGRITTGLAVQHLHLVDLRKAPIHLPPLPEQRRIAGILRTWDEAIDAASRLIDAKRRRLDGVAARLFASTRAIGGGRRPEGWTRMTFGDAFAERKTRNPGLLDTDVVTVGKYAIRKQSEHFKRSVASKDLSPYWVISPGDFVYDPMSAYYGALGRFDGASDGVVSPAYRVIRLAKGLDSDFMAELLKQHHVRFQLDALSSQGNKEGKRRSLQRSAFDSVEFFAPGQNAQREMAGKVALFRADLAASETHLDALKRQKRGLMQKLLTGDWRVPAEPAG